MDAVASEIWMQKFIERRLGAKLQKVSQMRAPLLVVGAAGSPVLPVAQILVQQRLCSSLTSTGLTSASLQPCRTCAECLNVLAGQGTRFRWVQPDGAFIKVEQSREVIEFLSLKQDRAHVVLIHQADRMNPQAANALLKTLEEPPENAWIVLTATSLKKILPTVRSRVQILSVPLLDDIFMREVLAENAAKMGGDEIAANKLLASMGSSLRFLQGRWDRLLKGEDFLTDLKNLETWLGQIYRHEEPELLEWMESREGFIEGLEKIRLLLKDKFLSGQFPHAMSWMEKVSGLDDLEEACLQNVDRKLLQDRLYSLFAK